MAPEQEARQRAFYDHESDEPRRRRRAAADWGVGEDIFDRMPSRRFARTERRAEHRDVEGRRFESGDEIVIRRGDVTASDEVRRGEPARREVAPADERPASQDATGRGEQSRAEARAEARAVMSWGDDLDEGVDRPLVRGESRTIVLARDEEEPRADETGDFAAVEEPPARKTIVISGHPDRVMAARPARPPRTAVERIGTSPDRIVAYAVALGFLLVLIAVLTTGQ